MAVDSRAGRFSFEWGCTDMAAGKTLDGRTPRICPIYATDKLRNMGKIWKNRKAFYIVAGGMAGEIGYLLLCMNGWKGY